MNSLKNNLNIALLCFFTSSMTYHAYGETILNFGVYTSDKPTEMVKQFRPILNAIEKSMNKSLADPVKIRMQVSKSYEHGIKAIVNGDVDFCRLGPASYIQAKGAEPQLKVIAVESNKGKKTFLGIICVNDQSKITSIDQLKGKSFAFGSELSTIGRYLSQYYLYEHGVISSDLKKYEYLGRHDKVGMAVALKQFDAGALKESTFKKLVSDKQPLRKIASFPNVTKPWVARKGLTDELYFTLKKALLNITDEAALENLKKAGFLQGDDSDYNTIRKSILENNLFFK